MTCLALEHRAVSSRTKVTPPPAVPAMLMKFLGVMTPIHFAAMSRYRLTSSASTTPRHAGHIDLRLPAAVDSYPHAELGKLASFLPTLEHVANVSARAHALVMVLVFPVSRPSMIPRR